MTKLVFSAATLSLILLTTPALAGINAQFLLLDPIRFFTDADWEIENETAVAAAENNADGETSTWENKDTGQSGTITPLRSYTNKKSETCRAIRFTNRKDELTSENTILACKQADGDWYISDAAQMKLE